MDSGQNEMVIRPARQDEVEAVVRLHFLTRSACMPYLPVLHTIGDAASFFASVVFKKCNVLVAECGDSLLGYCAFRDGWLDHLYVHPDHQNEGLGSALMARVMAAKDSLHLWVFQRNVGAMRFYERLGFRLVKTTDGRDNEEREPDALFYWRRTYEGTAT